MAGRRAPGAALMVALAMVAGRGDAGAPPRHPPARGGQRARPAPPVAQAPAAPIMAANGLPTFAEAPAPLAPAQQRTPSAALEPQVQAMLAQRCPAQPIVAGARAELADFDQAFGPVVAPSASPATQQAGLEAYRRCIDRAIAAIQASPSYVIRNPQENDCVECRVLLSDLALQVPRLRVLKGLTYLTPPHMADQNPRQALDVLRQGVADFGAVQTAFQQQAAAAFEIKRRIVREQKRQAEHRAVAQGKGAALSALLGAGLGVLRGQNAGQSLQSAGGTARQQLGQVATDLAKNEQQVLVQQTAINGNRRGLFNAPTLGNWSDDGIRVTLPRTLAPVARGGATVTGPAFGALASAFHADRIVRILFKTGRDELNGCTGAIVGPRLVLTNRHCVTTEGGEGAVLKPDAFTIEWRYAAATDTGMKTAITTSHVARVVTTDLAQHLSVRSENDWAFLVTRERVGEGGWLRLADPARVAAAGELRIALAGYSADLNEGSEITVDWGCRARLIGSSLFHRCHMWSGASGSPIVTVDGQFARDEIVGVNAADYGDLQSGSQEGLRVGPASAEMYQMWQRLRAEQRRDE